nr:MAG TPA: hypothetical protein [Caudoviricetes sp.]
MLPSQNVCTSFRSQRLNYRGTGAERTSYRPLIRTPRLAAV